MSTLFAVSLEALGLVRATPLAQEEATVPSPRALRTDDVPQLAQAHLTGRANLLAAVATRCRDGSAVALVGIPGVGKSALVLHLTHRPEIQAQFPDGILWIGLGPTPYVDSGLHCWGTALGISSELAQLTQRADLCQAIHRAIGTQRLLLIIDDVWDIEAALAFKIGGSHCAHVLTTRSPALATQLAPHDVIVVPELCETDGYALLAEAAPDVAKPDDPQIRALVQAAGGLPLTLTLMGRYLYQQGASRSRRRIQVAMSYLQDAAARLTLSTSLTPLERSSALPLDIPFSLHAMIMLSTQALDGHAQNLLHQVSVFAPKPQRFSEAAALAISGFEPATLYAALDALVDAGLLEVSAPDYYTLHQAIAEYGRLHGDIHPVERRLCTYYADFTQAHQTDHAALAEEVTNALYAFDIAHQHGWWDRYRAGVLGLSQFCITRGMLATILGLLTRAYDALPASAETTEQQELLLQLCLAHNTAGDFKQADIYGHEGYRLAHTRHDARHLTAFCHLLGDNAMKRSKYLAAETYLHEGLILARAGHLPELPKILLVLGLLAQRRNALAQADVYNQEGLDVVNALGNRRGVCAFLCSLGISASQRCAYAEANTYFQQALALARELQMREAVCVLLNNLGILWVNCDDMEAAFSVSCESLTLAREDQLYSRVCQSLVNLGEQMLIAGDLARSQAYLQEVLVIGRARDLHEEVIQGLLFLSEGALKGADISRATTYLEEAAALVVAQTPNRQEGRFAYMQGTLWEAQARWDEASAAYRQACDYAQAGEQRDKAAIATFGLARVRARQGDQPTAVRMALESLTTLHQIGHYRKNEVEQWLLAHQ